MLWPFLSVIIAFLNPETLTFFPLVILVLFCLLIILILVTFTLKIFSIFFFKLVLFDPAGTLKTILFCSDKLVDNVLYKTNANYKGRHAKTKQQNDVAGPTSKIYAEKGTGNARHASRKHQFLLVVVLHTGLKANLLTKKEN